MKDFFRKNLIVWGFVIVLIFSVAILHYLQQPKNVVEWLLDKLVIGGAIAFLINYISWLTTGKDIIAHRHDCTGISDIEIRKVMQEVPIPLMIRVCTEQDVNPLEQEGEPTTNSNYMNWLLCCIDRRNEEVTMALPQMAYYFDLKRKKVKKGLRNTHIGLRDASDYDTAVLYLEKKLKSEGINYLPDLKTTKSWTLMGLIFSPVGTCLPDLNEIPLEKVMFYQVILNTLDRNDNPQFKGNTADSIGKIVLSQFAKLKPLCKDLYVNGEPRDWDDKDTATFLSYFKRQ